MRSGASADGQNGLTLSRLRTGQVLTDILSVSAPNGSYAYTISVFAPDRSYADILSVSAPDGSYADTISVSARNRS